MQIDDPIARSNAYLKIMEMECNCGHLQDVEVEEEYSHHTFTWFAQWECSRCGEDREQGGWYTDDDL